MRFPRYNPMFSRLTAVVIRIVVITACAWSVFKFKDASYSGAFGTTWYAISVWFPVIMIIACLGRLIWFGRPSSRHADNSTLAKRRGQIMEVLGPIGIGLVLILIGTLIIFAGREVYYSEILGTYMPGNVEAPLSDRGGVVIFAGIAVALVGLLYSCVGLFLAYENRPLSSRDVKKMNKWSLER